MEKILETLCNGCISEVVSVCNELGVRVVDSNDNYRNTYDVLTDLSKTFNS